MGKKYRQDGNESKINVQRKEKGLSILLIFISSPLEIVSGEEKTPAWCATSILQPRFHKSRQIFFVNFQTKIVLQKFLKKTIYE